jgi:putative oxygen-independent coproporphyrinogen III oxidase
MVIPAVAGAAAAPSIGDLMRAGTLRLPALPPLALYVHVPWCVRKCPYCDFNSHEAGGDLPEAAYLDALRADLESALPLVWGRPVASVFVGGGTPSLLSVAAVERLLSDVRARLPLTPDCEITLEANPGTYESGKFAAFRAAGVNRLSIGVQSFDPAALRRLGRIHDGEQAAAAVAAAAAAFDNFNLDLMYALPGQSLDDCRRDLATALGCAPPHLSLYQLTLEPNTYFARHPPVLPDEDEAAAMHEAIEAGMAQAGYDHYEVSAYARPQHACRHNLNYWSFGDYLGIGAGAHSKLSFPQRIVRQIRFRTPALYLERAARGEFLAESREVARADLPFEFMLNALRLNGGFPLRWFAERTGLPVSAIDPGLAQAQTKGLLVVDRDAVRPTELGRRFLSNLQELFLPKSDRGA